jgi:EmrB/QacA subfamily drug resistance transporter
VNQPAGAAARPDDIRPDDIRPDDARPDDARPQPARRWLVLAICCMSVFVVGIDVTIVNVALPAIRADFHASVSGLQWTIDAYTLVIACLLLLSGSLADRFGRRLVFQAGLAAFSLGSLLCSLAPDLGWLVAFRGLQAVGGSMLNPVAMAIIANTFPGRRERAKAVGVWGSVVGLSLAAGPVIGGVLVSAVSWRAVFWINIPIGVAVIIATRLFVPESRAPRARRLDPAAQALMITALGSLTYAVIEGPDRGWASPLILGLFALAAVAAVAFVRTELRSREPLIDVRFFRSPPFAGASVIALAAFGALGGFLFLNTLYLQDVRGYSALHAGLLTIPMAAMIAIFGSVSGRLVARWSARPPFLIAGPALAIGALMLTRLTAHTSLAYLLAAYVIFGLGCGFVNAPITSTAVAGMPVEQAGVAGAVASTSRQVGSSLGVAVTGSIIASGAGAASAGASQAAWAVIAGLGVLVLLVGLGSTGPRARAAAARNGARLARRAEGNADDQPVTAAR